MEDKLAQVARLLASEIEKLKDTVATQKASEDATYVSLDDLEDWNVSSLHVFLCIQDLT